MKDKIKQILREDTKISQSIEIQPPNPLILKKGFISVFLAGSIGVTKKAEEWQKKIINALSNEQYIFLNPRRDDWDSSLEQNKDNKQFREQVEWELNALEKADKIIMYFDPETDSPISLLELGIHAKDGKMIVCCPEGFWRKGNVDITCEKYGVKQVDSLDELIEILKSGKL